MEAKVHALRNISLGSWLLTRYNNIVRKQLKRTQTFMPEGECYSKKVLEEVKRGADAI